MQANGRKSNFGPVSCNGAISHKRRRDGLQMPWAWSQDAPMSAVQTGRMRVAYPTTAIARQGRWRVAVPDVPGTTAEGASRVAAMADAGVLLATALRDRIEEQGELPRPSTVRIRRGAIAPPALAAAKLLLLQTVREQELSNVAVGRRLGIAEGSVRRLLDLDQRSHIGGVEAALAALGRRLVVESWPLP